MPVQLYMCAESGSTGGVAKNIVVAISDKTFSLLSHDFESEIAIP